MKKTVLTFGLISGAVLSAMMMITLPFHDTIGFDRSLIIGYTTMVIAFLLIFFGIRSYRDNVAGGTVRFGRAFSVGALIAVVASLCYVATWEVLYYNFYPDYLAKYQTYALEKARAEGATPDAIAKEKAEMDRMAELYRNPAFNVAFTFMEPLPVALVMSLLSAARLRKRPASRQAGVAIGATSAAV